MPTYSYRCTKCNRIFDVFHSMSCKAPQYCPVCGGNGIKLLSASSVIFKGSGFYTTDYRDSGYLEAKKQDGPNTAKNAPDSSKNVSGGSDKPETITKKTEGAKSAKNGLKASPMLSPKLSAPLPARAA